MAEFGVDVGRRRDRLRDLFDQRVAKAAAQAVHCDFDGCLGGASARAASS